MFSLPASRRTRLLAVPAIAAAVVTLAALPASAHVTITPDTATQGGGDVQLTFRVPNEESGASTTQLQVAFPTDHPIASVLVEPIPGWSAKVTDTTLATPIHTDDGDISQVVSQITWSGGSIAPGQYGAFTVLLGQLPSNASQVVFKAVQTYSNGDVVRWIDLAQPGQPEPDHPAPVLALTKSTETAAVAATTAAASSSAATPKVASTSDSTARCRRCTTWPG
ncbi:MAG TPA: YcnI family protein [Actinocrinis sp.]|uniref:YcnI family copper-binding membrane protein n=1 Tax=Actinocrinis sp. TaxID=1920516 RepID=UPI002DDD712C|nr:YcnI family protein [Actinocrinis sp.]HEV2344008.1 YcnI family protein [Actinocrinis sp.]